ncbi:hypothetical protein QA596_06970 [Balneolales bacterium ANBcel1]|nr:hypothetical protein [Balneolales bacterium ANBcel1]
MSRYRFVIALIPLMVFAGWQPLSAQSRTEEAKDRLDGKSDDHVVVQAARVMWHVGIDVMPMFFYFQPAYEDEPPLRYTRYPYANPKYSGIRTFEEGSRGLWDIEGTFSLPQTTWAMQQASARVKRNIRYWSLIAGYEYMKEDDAPYGIHQTEFLFERKFRFVSQGDGGLQLGMRTLRLDGSTYRGPDIGINVELYPWRPFSLRYAGSWTYTTHADVINHQLDFGVHVNAMRLFFRYRWLDIGGVKFGTLTAGTGFYF